MLAYQPGDHDDQVNLTDEGLQNTQCGGHLRQWGNIGITTTRDEMNKLFVFMRFLLWIMSLPSRQKLSTT
ncbi:MAG: hypothetical protein PVI73_06455 [Syntrophobacterales bacterium]